VGEAISLIGYERNADRIPATLYAPVLRNMDRWQRAVTIVQFAADPALTTRSMSWYVWELSAAHIITTTLPAVGEYGPAYWVVGKNQDKGSLIWKGAVFNTTDNAHVTISLSFEVVEPGMHAALTVLTNVQEDKDPFAHNDPLTGINVVGSETVVLEADEEGAFVFDMPELSVAVLDTDVEGTIEARRRVKF
jgi:alpha-L-arabinofuranosidase